MADAIYVLWHFEGHTLMHQHLAALLGNMHPCLACLCMSTSISEEHPNVPCFSKAPVPVGLSEGLLRGMLAIALSNSQWNCIENAGLT